MIKTKLFYYLIVKTLLAFFRFYFSCKTYFFKTLILALIKSWFK
ncbi:hypothetical protein HMPREF1408_01393, partial [Helicobacter pylori GAM245Ai]